MKCLLLVLGSLLLVGISQVSPGVINPDAGDFLLVNQRVEIWTAPDVDEGQICGYLEPGAVMPVGGVISALHLGDVFVTYPGMSQVSFRVVQNSLGRTVVTWERPVALVPAECLFGVLTTATWTVVDENVWGFDYFGTMLLPAHPIEPGTVIDTQAEIGNGNAVRYEVLDGRLWLNMGQFGLLLLGNPNVLGPVTVEWLDVEFQSTATSLRVRLGSDTGQTVCGGLALGSRLRPDGFAINDSGVWVKYQRSSCRGGAYSAGLFIPDSSRPENYSVFMKTVGLVGWSFVEPEEPTPFGPTPTPEGTDGADTATPFSTAKSSRTPAPIATDTAAPTDTATPSPTYTLTSTPIKTATPSPTPTCEPNQVIRVEAPRSLESNQAFLERYAAMEELEEGCLSVELSYFP